MAKLLKFSILFFLLGPLSCTETIYLKYLYSKGTPTDYFTHSEEVTVEVYYETGMAPDVEPFTMPGVGTRPVWEILEDNLISIFQYRSAPPTVHVPLTLAEMTELPASDSTGWTIEEMLDYHKNHKLANPTSTHARFYFYFVKGYFEAEGVTNSQILGVNITNTPILFVFKQVINNSSGSAAVKRFVEQSTLVHEMGHALGLVNNGVPMHTPHQDVAHGAHTTNPDCVMYYMNEGASGLAGFFTQVMTTGSVVLWGPEVLQDVEAFSK